VGTVNPSASGFIGGIFDGRYLYLVPHNNGAHSGIMARYDTQAPFGTGTSWSSLGISTTNTSAIGFQGGTFDGRYVYLAPINNGAFDGLVPRYDTRSGFTSGSSWVTVNVTTTVNSAAKGFFGGAFDGRYVYFVPNFSGTFDGVIARYDTQLAFQSAGSWNTFDVANVNANATGFIGAVFDGRYLYLVPGTQNDNTPSSTVARFDAKQPPALWPLCANSAALHCDTGSFF